MNKTVSGWSDRFVIILDYVVPGSLSTAGIQITLYIRWYVCKGPGIFVEKPPVEKDCACLGVAERNLMDADSMYLVYVIRSRVHRLELDCVHRLSYFAVRLLVPCPFFLPFLLSFILSFFLSFCTAIFD